MDRIGPFALQSGSNVHADTLRRMVTVDWPWWTLLTHHRGRITVTVHPADRWWFDGIYTHADGGIKLSTDRHDIPYLIAHEVGHAVDAVLFGWTEHQQVMAALGTPDGTAWGGGGLPHHERPSEAWANYFAWRVGEHHATRYGPHTWASVDTQDRLEEIVMAAADTRQLFTDVPDGSTHAEGIRWAAGLGLIEGYDDGTFRPGEAVTRGQLATILYRQSQQSTWANL